MESSFSSRPSSHSSFLYYIIRVASAAYEDRGRDRENERGEKERLREKEKEGGREKERQQVNLYAYTL